MLTSTIFRSYLQQTKTMCIYRIGSEKLCPKLSFPDIHTVSLIHCSRYGVSNVLTPHRFPNLKTIHYLSAHPGQVDIYQRFSKPIEWLFPNRKYLFYNCMMDAGLGSVERSLIRKYIHSLRITPYEIELNLPGFGLYDGAQYRLQLIKCLQEPYRTTNPFIKLNIPYNDTFENKSVDEDNSIHSLSAYLNNKKDDDFFNILMNDCEKEEKYRDPSSIRHYP